MGLKSDSAVLTNTTPDGALGFNNPTIEPLVIDPASPAAATVANTIPQQRAATPRLKFRDVGDLLAVPQLSDGSPWLNLGSSTQLRYGITDAAYEALPSQLLPLLRPDPIGSIASESGQLRVRFTGFDGHSLALEISPDLQTWTTIATNAATNGIVEFTPTAAPNLQFFRARLVP